ncbi:MAG: glycosyltransferase family 2 protein [Patescibacteria group bacterium]|nr:glycosyltransferase family 2 protein [Patescibacteria group bacterium]
MSLSIIIVSWNTRELTLKCLRSIFDYFHNVIPARLDSRLDSTESKRAAKQAQAGILTEVFLVDNNSSDGTVAAVAEFKKENNLENLQIIANKENLGFAKANNQALKIVCHSGEGRNPGTFFLDPVSRPGMTSKNDFILLLNPDTELINNGIEKAIEFIKMHPACGILGPKLLNSDGTLQKSCRRFPKLLDQIFVQLKFYNFFPEKIDSIKEYFMLDFKHDEIREVDQIMGAAMLIKREVFNKIGLLDENFWAVFEEVDFCLRAKSAGYKTYFFPNWQIIHHKEQSFKQVASLRKQINFNKSLYHYFRKHKPFWQLFILWLLQPINLLLTWLDSVIGVRKIFGKNKNL